MKWLFWSPAIAIVLAAVAVPGGLVLFGLPLLALGYFLVAVIAVSGGAERRTVARGRAVREHREPTSHLSQQGVPTEQPEPVRPYSSRPRSDSAAREQERRAA